MYGFLAREHGWTYDSIDRMDLNEFFGAIKEIAEYRKKILPTDVSLHALKTVLFNFLGIKERPAFDPKKLSSLNMPHFTFTEKQKDEWIAAGMPDPKKFFNKKRKK